MILRCVSRFFFHNVPKPTHVELLAIEIEGGAASKFFACGGCLRLRHVDKFCTELTIRGDNPLEDFSHGGMAACTRFCNDCGIRDLPGDFRYSAADRWDVDGVCWVRCLGVRRSRNRTGLPIIVRPVIRPPKIATVATKFTRCHTGIIIASVIKAPASQMAGLGSQRSIFSINPHPKIRKKSFPSFRQLKAILISILISV